MTPAVSVVMPAYNAAPYVGAAVRSVLGQTFGDLELLVIDDGSTDHTAQVVALEADRRLRYLWQPNGGVAAARNHGLREARGQHIGFLDADDTWSAGKLERQLAVLDEPGAPAATFSAHTVVDADLRPLRVSRFEGVRATFSDLLLRGNVIGSICSVLCRSGLARDAGGFDPALSQCADWDFWLRLARYSDFAYLDEPLVTYRQHASNMSRDARLLERDSLRVLGKAYADPLLPPALAHTRRRALGRMYMVCAGTYYQAGLRRDFMRAVLHALWLSPRQASRLLAYPVRVWRRRGAAAP
jgi:glycosyltransferase involved in cell wall biosynthesis